MSGPSPNDHVLIVDDDHDIRETVIFILESAGYRVLAAANGAEALELLGNGAPPCAILLDLMMPVMDGWAFRAEQLRDPRLSAVPVVVLTGAGQANAKAEELGVAESLEKPFDFDSLLSTIRRHCSCARGP